MPGMNNDGPELGRMSQIPPGLGDVYHYLLDTLEITWGEKTRVS